MDQSLVMLTRREFINVKVPWDEDIKDVIVDFPDYISQLLLCNSPPTDEEHLLVTGYLQGAIEMLFEVQENLRALERFKSSTEDSSAEPTYSRPRPPSLSLPAKMIDATRIILSPVRRTPPEIVEEIALMCYSEPVNLDVPLAARFPMRLCCVSSAWRRSIESYTQLWRHIRCDPGVGHSTRFFELTIQRYMRLADATPIHLDLVLAPTRQHSSEKTERFVSRTVSLLTQWKGRAQMSSLSIDFGSAGVSYFMKIAGRMRFGSFPNLQTISFYAPHQSASVTIFKRIFMDAPSLRQLRLVTDHSHSNFDVLPQSMMSSLTQVDIKGRYFTPAQWMLLIVGCSKLQGASFDLEGPPPHFEQAVRITELQELKTLSLNFRPACLFNPYLPFRWITFPRLTALHLSLSSPSLARLRILEISYRPKLSRLTQLSITANISRGIWGIDDEGELNPGARTDTSSEDIVDAVRRLLTLAAKDLDTLQLSLSAPSHVWRDIFRIWTGVYETPFGLNDRNIPAMKSLHLGVPAEVILRGCGESLLQLVVRQINHPICKLQHFKVSIGVEKYDNQEKIDRSIDFLEKGLETYVNSNELTWEHDVLRYQPTITPRNANRYAVR